MTRTELREALAAGHSRFRHRRSGRVYVVDRAASLHLLQEDESEDITVIGYPETRIPRRSGRVWQFLSPRSLETA